MADSCPDNNVERRGEKGGKKKVLKHNSKFIGVKKIPRNNLLSEELSRVYFKA